MMNKKLLLIPVLIFVFLLVYSPHFSYQYPFHVDEWNHIEMGMRLFAGDYSLVGGHFEIGYHFFLGLLSLFGLNLVLFYKFLPALFAVFASAILFFLMLNLTKKWTVALASSILFVSLPTNVNLLGLWFAIPLTFAIPLIYLFFYLFISSEPGKKNLLLSLLVLLAILLVHPSSGIFVALVALIYLGVNGKASKKNFLLIFIPVIFFGLLAFVWGWQGGFSETVKFLFGMGIFPNSDLNLPLSLFALLLFGLIGFVPSLRNRKLRVFCIMFLFALFLFLVSFVFPFTFIARRPRLVYFAFLGLVPLSAIGLYKIINFAQTKIKLNAWRILIIGLIILLALSAVFFNYGKQEQGTELYNLIDENDFEALQFLGSLESGTMVIAPLHEAMAVYPISENFVIADLHQIDSELKDDMKRFFAVDCEEKARIITRYKNRFGGKYPQHKTLEVKYVYSKNSIDCDNLVEVYAYKSYIYRII